MAASIATNAFGARRKKLIKPRALQAGDLVGLITPASNPASADSYPPIEENMKALGLRWRYGASVRKFDSYLAGPAAARIEDVHAMFRDPEVKAVLTIRGGYGSPQLLDGLDYGLIRKHPKIFLGYSDITAMHLGIHQRTGLVTMHGPALTKRWPPYSEEHLRRAMFETKPLGVLRNPEGKPVRAIRGGRVTAPLIAGNLSLITNLMGTPYEVDCRGKILCIEDVGEDWYRIDRMLTQLRLAGKLNEAAGIVWGECQDCVARTTPPHPEALAVDEILKTVRTPVLGGLLIGHTEEQLTLPQGVRATLDADAGTLTIEEPALAS